MSVNITEDGFIIAFELLQDTMNSVCRAIKTDLLLSFNNITDRIAYEAKEELGSYYELWTQLVSTKLVQEGYRRLSSRQAFTGDELRELPEYVIVKGSSLSHFNLNNNGNGAADLTLNVDYFTNRWECFVHNLQNRYTLFERKRVLHRKCCSYRRSTA